MGFITPSRLASPDVTCAHCQYRDDEMAMDDSQDCYRERAMLARWR